MGIVFTSFGPDKKPLIFDMTVGEKPEEAAERCGILNCVWEYCESRAEAERRIARDPNGKMGSY